MALIFDTVCADVISISIALVAIIVTYFKWSFKYWERRNVPYQQPYVPFGSLSSPFSEPKNFGEQIKLQYDNVKNTGQKHSGMFVYTVPVYLPIHPEMVKNILSKDFQHFVNRGVYFNEKDDPISAHLFSVEGTKWRNLRAKLSPTFTSGKMKSMFQTVVAVGEQLNKAMEAICTNNEPLDIKEVFGCFSTDIIGSCAFGIDCNSFEMPDSDFRKYGKKVFMGSKFMALKGFLSFSKPKLARWFGLVLTDVEVSNFFMKIVKETVAYREENNVIRKDFLQILIDLKNNVNNDDNNTDAYKHDGKSLTIEELAAQAFVFFLAGFETSSTTVTFCLYHLAKNPEIQQKVRNEINIILSKHNGQITYDAIMEMKYMQQVIDETLRMYPPVPVLNRECTQAYTVPDTDVVIEVGTRVLISILGLQHDGQYFPNPEKFDPERFSEENKSLITPFTYLPFGEGPRNCIGLRFGLLQSKVGLTVLLKNFIFSVNSKTQEPLQMEPLSFVLSTVGGVWLDVKKVDKKQSS